MAAQLIFPTELDYENGLPWMLDSLDCHRGETSLSDQELAKLARDDPEKATDFYFCAKLRKGDQE